MTDGLAHQQCQWIVLILQHANVPHAVHLMGSVDFSAFVQTTVMSLTTIREVPCNAC